MKAKSKVNKILILQLRFFFFIFIEKHNESFIQLRHVMECGLT